MKTISFLRQGKVSWAVPGDSLSALQILGDIKLKLKKGESLNEGERASVLEIRFNLIGHPQIISVNRATVLPEPNTVL